MFSNFVDMQHCLLQGKEKEGYVHSWKLLVPTEDKMVIYILGHIIISVENEKATGKGIIWKKAC